jgi:hypothetical protein
MGKNPWILDIHKFACEDKRYIFLWTVKNQLIVASCHYRLLVRFTKGLGCSAGVASEF